jgi:hypothetical protein
MFGQFSYIRAVTLLDDMKGINHLSSSRTHFNHTYGPKQDVMIYGITYYVANSGR